MPIFSIPKDFDYSWLLLCAIGNAFFGGFVSAFLFNLKGREPFSGFVQGFIAGLLLSPIGLAIIWAIFLTRPSNLPKVPQSGSDYTICSKCGLEQWNGYDNCQKCGTPLHKYKYGNLNPSTMRPNLSDSDYVKCRQCGFEQWRGNNNCQKCGKALL
jgi:hypothetical protein